MFVVVIVFFVFCVFLNNIMWLWFDFGDGENYKYFWNMVVVFNIIFFVNSVVNLIVYIICYENFRDEFCCYIYFFCGSKKRGVNIERSYKLLRLLFYVNGFLFSYFISCYLMVLLFI